jgi:hypothetical protein
MDAMKMKRTDLIPRRVAARPDPKAWGDDEPLSLMEAAALFFPDGEPLSEKSLRHAARTGKLAITVVAGKILTSPAAIRDMLKPKLVAAPPPTRPPPEPAAPSASEASAPPGVSRARRKLVEALGRGAAAGR